jgi:hypothetical protein
MKLDEIIDKLTISKQTITEYYNEGYGTSEFKIKDTSVFTDDVIKYFSEELNSGFSLGFVKTEEDFRVRPAELTVVTGISSHGKSLWLSQVVLSIMGQNAKCLIASLEMRPVLTLARMIQQSLKTTDPTDDYIRKFCTRASDKLYIYDQTGSTTSDDMIATMHYGKHVLGIDVFVIDSLMKLTDISETEYEQQKLFLDRCATTCRDLNVHLFLVCHTRKMMNDEQIPDATNILLSELQTGPFAKFYNGPVSNFVHQVILRDAFVNLKLPQLDTVPEQYTRNSIVLR